jgi:hypothetical protein
LATREDEQTTFKQYVVLLNRKENPTSPSVNGEATLIAPMLNEESMVLQLHSIWIFESFLWQRKRLKDRRSDGMADFGLVWNG